MVSEKLDNVLYDINAVEDAVGLEDDLLHIPNVNSAEGLVDALKNEKSDCEITGVWEGTRAFIHLDEMRNMFINANRSATQSIVPRLNDLWGCPPRAKLTTRNKPVTAHYPVVNILGGTTYRCLADSIDSQMMENGFINRFMLFP